MANSMILNPGNAHAFPANQVDGACYILNPGGGSGPFTVALDNHSNMTLLFFPGTPFQVVEFVNNQTLNLTNSTNQPLIIVW